MPRVGAGPLQALDAGQLNRMYAQLLADGNRSRKPDGSPNGALGLSPRTVAYVHTIMHRALKDAVKWGRLVRNPRTPPTHRAPAQR